MSVVRTLAAAGIAVEDELGEIPEPSLAVQIQRAILDYYQDDAGLESLLALIELLNEHAAVWDHAPDGPLRGAVSAGPRGNPARVARRVRRRAAPQRARAQRS